MSYLTFKAEIVDYKIQHKIINEKQEPLGRLEQMRIGQWMSWCLFLNPDCYLSASCQDEVREKTRMLNSRKIVAK